MVFKFFSLAILLGSYSTQAFSSVCDVTLSNQELIQQYSNLLYLHINPVLRGMDADASCLKLAAQLNTALLQMKPLENIPLYRGAYYGPELKTLKPGDCITDGAFMSTSKDEQIARKFAGQDGILFSITSDQ